MSRVINTSQKTGNEGTSRAFLSCCKDFDLREYNISGSWDFPSSLSTPEETHDAHDILAPGSWYIGTESKLLTIRQSFLSSGFRNQNLRINPCYKNKTTRSSSKPFEFLALFTENLCNNPNGSSVTRTRRNILVEWQIGGMNETQLAHAHTHKIREQCALWCVHLLIEDAPVWLLLLLPERSARYPAHSSSMDCTLKSWLGLEAAASSSRSRWTRAADACHAFGGASGPSCW